MTRLQARIDAAESTPLPSGTGDRFGGYGVMGLTFSTGHVLALRRFPASSIGPGYTSVWHRGPDGDWVMWQDQPAEHACPRYFSSAIRSSRQVTIDVSWPRDAVLHVEIPDVGLQWTSVLSATPSTSVLNVVSRALPDRAWRSPFVLGAVGPVAGGLLRAGRVSLAGSTPNGQHFVANPQRLWVIDSSIARLGAQDLGRPGPLPRQASLGDFEIPQRGVFVIGQASFDAADPRAPEDKPDPVGTTPTRARDVPSDDDAPGSGR